MSHLKKRFIPLILILFMIASSSPSNNNVTGWGLVTHTGITEEAILRVEAAWLDVFDFYSIEIHQGVLYPDVALQDWDNHLYYPDDPTSKTGPTAIQTNLDLAISQFNAGEWADGFFRLGIAGHYMEDMNIPIHTGELFGGDIPGNNPIHSKIEGDINAEIIANGFTFTPRMPIELNSSYTVEMFAITQATAANAFRDDVMSVYLDATTNHLVTNATYYDMIEQQLNEAIFSIGTLFKNAVVGITVPNLPARTSIGFTVIDSTHQNDYADGALDQVTDDLNRTSEVLSSFAEITATSSGVHTLILTVPEVAYSATEIESIKTWLAGGERNMIFTSKSDFDDTLLRSSINDILAAINSQIRVNDDSVYTSGPGAYYPSGATNGYTWYVETDQIVAPADTDGMTADVNSIQFYQPSSLYFTSTNENLTVLVKGEKYSFQSDEKGSPIEFVWDDTMDSTGGDSIPLAAAEIIGDDKIAVFGATIFSDFDYGRVESVILLHNVLEWFDKPVAEEVTSTPASTTTLPPTTTITSDVDTTDTTDDTEPESVPLPILPAILGLSTLVVATYRRKANK